MGEWLPKRWQKLDKTVLLDKVHFKNKKYLLLSKPIKFWKPQCMNSLMTVEMKSLTAQNLVCNLVLLSMTKGKL